jgi:hypothetical protein
LVVDLNLRSQEQTASGLTDSLTENLLIFQHAADKEAKAQTEKHSSEDGTENSSLDDVKHILGEKDHEKDDFDDRTDSKQAR